MNQSQTAQVALTISKEEWRWAIRWTTIFLMVSSIPYLAAILLAPDGWQFAGILVNPLDGHSYLAKMAQGVSGNWLFQMTYTPETHDGSFMFTFYLFLGHVARLTGLPKILIFHLARLLAGFLLLLVAFRFTSYVLPDPTERKLAFVLMLTASGLGWLGAIFGAFPIDLWIPEAFVPYSLYANPHFPLGTALMLLLLMQVTWGSRFQLPASKVGPESSNLNAGTWNLKRFIQVGLVALILAVVLPFALIIVWLILAISLGWRFFKEREHLPWRQIWLTVSTIVGGAPVILYQYRVSTTHPIMLEWAAQNITAAPAVTDLVLGYGLVGLWAVVGILWLGWPGRAAATEGAWLLLIWVSVTLVLLYTPFALQRRFLTGLHVPLCILAALGLIRALARTRLKLGYQRLIITGSVTLGAVGTLFVWVLPLLSTLQSPVDSSVAALLFIRRSEAEAFAWLRSQVDDDDIILASPRVGMFIPGQTGARSFYGHPFETIDAKDKAQQATAFYQGRLETTTPPSDFIFYGPSERALGQPEILANLPVVYEAEDVVIYRSREQEVGSKK